MSLFEFISSKLIKRERRIRAANIDGPLAQLVEQLTLNQLVAGSIPARPTNKTTRKIIMKKGLLVLSFCLLNLNLAFAQSPSCSPSAGQVTLKQAIKWYRDSAEQTALYRQAYNAGTDYVENWVKVKHPQPKTWGVVLDIDETTLDNSWYFFRCDDVADKEADFEHFVTIQQKSVALPGVVEFTHRVHQLGGYVSLVSNRDGSYRDSTGASLAATVANLKQQQVEFDQVILANYKSSPKP